MMPQKPSATAIIRPRVSGSRRNSTASSAVQIGAVNSMANTSVSGIEMMPKYQQKLAR